MPARVGVLGTIFLASESRESMMHVAGLMTFAPPPGSPPDHLRELMDELRESPRVQAPWNERLRHPEFLTHPMQKWVADTEFDLGYHVRRSALPTPGGERELGILVSRLHSVQMDFHRPLWELQFIEGLSGGRFAMYAKFHHSMMDGYSAMKVLASSMSDTPDDHATPLCFQVPARSRAKRVDTDAPTLTALIAAVRREFRGQRRFGRAIATLGRSLAGRDSDLAAPLQAPKTLFNRRISRNRRLATQQYDLARLKRVADIGGGTLNDLALALCGSALRRLLSELNALPDKPLTAMLPVNIRASGDQGGGNAVGAILASLGTTVADPIDRLRAIVASTRRAKHVLQGMSPTAILEYSALLLAPVSAQMMTGTAGRLRPAFNLVISNVPGPREPLYFRGARMEAAYPLSIPFHGYGLNITLNSYAGTSNFGFIGCRESVPHLQRLAVYAGEALDELESALGV